LNRLLKLLGVKQIYLIGSSLGGRVIVDLALAYPKIVKSLVVVGSGLSGYQFTGEVFMQFMEKIITAREQKDYEQVCELRIKFWVDGLSRTPGQVDLRLRERVREMLLSQPGRQGEGQPLEPAVIYWQVE
jgi:pimeloyl-ACP methyl ester carboxylesterase